MAHHNDKLSVQQQIVSSRLAAFLLGIALSWIAFIMVDHARQRPYDISQGAVPSHLLPSWITETHVSTAGSYTVFTPSDRENASALLVSSSGHFPIVGVLDENRSGVLDGLMVGDRNDAGLLAKDVNEDGQFDSFSYSTKSFTFLDADMDGRFDYRLGPENKFFVASEPEWHEVIDVDEKRLIERDGAPVQLEFENGVWKIPSE